jgi:hypothetical protein
MIIVAGDFQSASSLLLPDRVEDDDYFKDGFAKVLLLCSITAEYIFRYKYRPRIPLWAITTSKIAHILRII